MLRFVRSCCAYLLLLAASGAMAQTVPADLVLTQLNVTGVAQPIAVAQPNDGTGRLFILSRTGNIYIFRNGAVVPTPYLSVPVSTSSEQGLLGIAFHPDFANNGRFFVQHTRAAGGTNIGTSADQLTVEYTAVPPNADTVNASTRRVLVTIGDMAGNHNGGALQFGPDGYLYISMGDGGPQNNPHGFAQCLWRKPADNNPAPANCTPGTAPNYFLLGKILRIDVDGTTPNATEEMCGTTTGQTAQYRIPPTNPHVGTTQTCDEIYHYGMRNPFRFSFDKLTGDMIVGDVGQNTWEEVDLIPNGSGPQNLGWSVCEGRQTFPGGAANSCNFGLLPILNYQHITAPNITPSSSRCSITGGFRYRGPITQFQGMIVYADYCTSEIFFGKPDGASPSGYSAIRWESQPATVPPTPIRTAVSPIGFGEDLAGNLYVTAQGGAVYRFDSPSAISDALFANGFE
mgnify:CR=1 FL=1